MDIVWTVVAIACALAGAAILVTALRRPSGPCEQALSSVAARCAELQDAAERLRVAGGHHGSVDATLRTALAEPAARIPDGPLAPALQTLRREHHHARDALMLAQAASSDAQRRYDEARAALPSNCGTCPPCVTATSA